MTNDQKNYLKWALGSVLFLILAIGSYFGFVPDSINPVLVPSPTPSVLASPSPVVSVSPSPSPTPSPSLTPSPSPTPSPSLSPVFSAWLSTSGNKILKADGTRWMGRGANVHDTRNCGRMVSSAGAPLYDSAQGIAEMKRRYDILISWHANFVRLDMESVRAQDNYLNSATYRATLAELVKYLTDKKVYVMVALWNDPTLAANGWPTAATNSLMAKVATDFYANPYVMYGVSNEPQANYDGAQDAQVWSAMKASVDAIRTAEAALGPNRHLVSVQGTRSWARELSYYTTHPIGANVIYETHIYDAPSFYAARFVTPSKTIPVVIGEFGPVNSNGSVSSVADQQTLIDQAEAAMVPYLAWTFHEQCDPNLLGSTAGMTWAGGSSTPVLNATLAPTGWGNLLKAQLLKF